MTKEKENNKKGQMFVGMVLIIGSIIAVVGVLFLFLSGSLVNTSYGIKAETVAQASATGGAEDATLQLDRNSFPSFPVTYSVPVGSTTATVNVNTNVPTAGFVTVTSTATFMGHTKSLKVPLSIDSNAQVNVISWTQIQ